MEAGAGPRKRAGMMLYIAAFLVIEIVFGYFIIESRALFVKNSIQDGAYLTQSQAAHIEARMEEYSFAVELAGKYLDEMVETHTTDAQIRQWMNSYCDKIADQFGGNILDLYAVSDGTIIAANPWEGDRSYDFTTTSWYADAVAVRREQWCFPICIRRPLPAF